MRTTTLLRQILGLKARVLGFELTPIGVLIDVAPTYRVPRCSACGRKVRSVHDRRRRKWRHLDFGGMMVRITYRIRRVKCETCGVRVEDVEWAAPGSGFTYPFEDQAGYLAQRCDKTTIASLLRVAWVTVGRIIQRVVQRHTNEDPLDGLTNIGVDELSYRRHHKFITVVVDHDSGRIVWAHKGRNADTLGLFFERLGEERTKALKVITIDMSKHYIKAIKERAPDAQIVFDRFHLQRIAHRAVDSVRAHEVRKAHAYADRITVRRTRWILLKRPTNLREVEKTRLERIRLGNQKLYRAYLLKETLVDILDHHDEDVARPELETWLAWASRSKLKPFVKLARTIRAHRDGILAYIATGFSNGKTEALNGKARTITRRAYGLHSAHALIALLRLCCGGIRLEPIHCWPGRGH